jgi:hypothetical protein
LGRLLGRISQLPNIIETRRNRTPMSIWMNTV